MTRPAASNQPTGKEKSAADNRAEVLRPKGVILVSEAFTEINAGLVIVLASGHENPIPISTLTDPDMDPDEVAHIVTRAYHEHVLPTLQTHIHQLT